MDPEVASPRITKAGLPQKSTINKPDNRILKRALLLCGLFSSLLYTLMNVFIPLLDKDYSSFSQTISEISAIDSPTRPIWVPFGLLYSVLIASFGLGVRMSAKTRRQLRTSGVLMIAYGIISFFWPPMHQREVLAAGEGTVTDILHVVFTLIVPLMMVAMGFAAASFNKQFRIYTIVSIVIMLVFGALTGLSSPQMQANLPTPWMGVWERVSAAAMMLWIAVVSIKLLREEKSN